MSRSFFTSVWTRISCFGVIAMLASSLAGCGPDYDRTEITGVKGGGVLTSDLDTHALVLSQGLVITAHIVVWNDDNVQMSLGVRAKDTTIVKIDPVVNERNYAFIGVGEGSTEIEFLADGNVVLTIPATVKAQPDATTTTK